MHGIDRTIKGIFLVFAIGGWLLSIFFSAQGFGLRGGALYITAGYFLSLLVTLFEVALNRYGRQLPKTLTWISLLAYTFGIVTNIVGIFQGRQGGEVADYAIAIALGIILECYPEPLLMFSLGVRSSDLMDTLGGLFGNRSRNQAYPQYNNPPRNPNVQGRVARQQQSRR